MKQEILNNQLFYDNSYRVFSELIEKKADVNITNSSGWTPLTFILSQFNKTDEEILKIVVLMVENKVDVNQSTKKYNWTPLMLAARRNYTETVKYLIEQDANVNETDSQNNTILDLFNEINPNRKNISLIKYFFKNNITYRNDKKNKNLLLIENELLREKILLKQYLINYIIKNPVVDHNVQTQNF